jgi:hypothetical protein
VIDTKLGVKEKGFSPDSPISREISKVVVHVLSLHI